MAMTLMPQERSIQRSYAPILPGSMHDAFFTPLRFSRLQIKSFFSLSPIAFFFNTILKVILSYKAVKIYIDFADLVCYNTFGSKLSQSPGCRPSLPTAANMEKIL